MNFPIWKSKSKKAAVWLFLVFRFSFSCFNVLLLSLAMSTVKQFLGDLHLFWEDILFRLRRALCCAYKKKIQVQIIVFNKKAVVKIYRVFNSKSPPWNFEYQVSVGRYLKNSVLNFLSFHCELMVNHKNIWFSR